MNSGELNLKVDDDSMIDMGIHTNDVVIAQPIAHPQDGEIIIAMLNGQIMLRKYFNIDKKICLVPENVSYPTIELSALDSFEIVGVVKKIINSHSNYSIKAAQANDV